MEINSPSKALFYADCPNGYLKWVNLDLPVSIRVKKNAEKYLLKCASRCNSMKKCGYFTYGRNKGLFPDARSSSASSMRNGSTCSFFLEEASIQFQSPLQNYNSTTFTCVKGNSKDMSRYKIRLKFKVYYGRIIYV